MRRLVFVVLAVFMALAVGAPSACVSPSESGSGGPSSDAATGDSGLLVQPQTATCSGSSSACLSGTAAVRDLPAPRYYVANLFGMYPVPGAPLLSRQIVAVDGTWAFGGLADSAHYYVQIEGVFGADADGGGGTPIAANVGPLAVPSSGAGSAVTVAPVELLVVQSSRDGAPLFVQSALASVFDRATGAPSEGTDTVSIVVGGASVPMPWTDIGSGQYAYYAVFPASTPAQDTYAITTSASSSAWDLVAATPGFTPSLTAPAASATVPAGQPLVVSWPPEPLADEAVWSIYDQASDGSWTPLDTSQVPAGAGLTQQSIPAADVAVGPLLIDVAFFVGSCPSTADGCVVSEAVASAQVTAQ
ncbi:MAG: hypothetical protein ACRELB_06175 [Polyangiaceae bacterium]